MAQSNKNRRSSRHHRQAGNAIVMLFAALSMAGVVTFGLNNIMRGPAATTSELSRRTIAENNMVASSRLAISGATRNQPNDGDCDRDGFVEAMAFRAPGPSPAPAGGGLLPMTIGASLADPWGNQYGYCVWDPGTLSVSDNITGCGGNTAGRLEGSPKDNQPAIAIISAGKNGTFETTCSAYADTAPADGIPDVNMVSRPSGSDDLLLSHTYAEANGIGAGEWSVKAGDPATAEISKDLDVDGGADFSGALRASGGFLLPQSAGADDVTGPCDQAKDQQMRINNSTNPPSLEICNFSGAGWVAVSGSGTSAPVYPSCTFPGAELSGSLSASSMGRSTVAKSRLITGTRSSGSDCSLLSVNVSSPSVMGITQTVNNCTGARAPDDAAVSGNMLYLISDSDDAFSVWDITSVSSMVYRGRVVNSTAMNSPQAIAPIDSASAVVASYDSDSLAVIDTSSPAAPAIAGGGTGYVSNATYMNGARDVEVLDTHAYVVGKLSNSLAVVDISNHAAPALAGNLVDATNLDSPDFIKILGNYAYIMSADATKDYLTVVNISAPASPVFVTTIDDHRTAAIRDVKLYGKYLFAISPDGITIFDLGNPESPLLVKTFAGNIVGTDPNGISVYGHYAYVTELDSGASFNGVKAINIGCDPMTGIIDQSMVLEDSPPEIPDRLDTALVAHWPMDEGTGTSVADVIGGNNGTFVNTPTWTTGVNGTAALNFNMDDRDSVTIPGLLGSLTSGSVSMWVNGLRYDTSGTNDFFSIGDRVILTLSQTEGFKLSVWNGASYTSLYSEEHIVGTGWHYVTATFTQPNQLYRIYVDGILMKELSSASSISYSGGAANTAIGADPTNTNNDFDGAIDDIRMHNVALGPSEAAELYRRMKAESTIRQESPVSASNNYTQPKAAVGTSHGCGIKRDKSVWCWGRNNYGQLGTGSVTDQTAPVRVGWRSYVSLTAGGSSTCAINIDGSLWCWGNNANGVLGVGSTSGQYSVPYKVGNGPYTQVSTSGSHTCAITAGSGLYCWGLDGNGQLGNGATTTTPQGSGVQVAGSWAYVSAGNLHTCGIMTNGSAWCWGSDSDGQLGNGSVTGNQTSPVEVISGGNGPWANITAGALSTCGVKIDGTAWCWGSNASKQLGNLYSPTSRDHPGKLSGMMRKFNYIDLSKTGAHGCALMADSSAWCWGSDSNGQLGNGTSLTGNRSVPTRLSGDGSWLSIFTGYQNTCGLRTDNSLWCAGTDTYGELGNGSISTGDQSDPNIVSGWVQKPTIGWSNPQDTFFANPGSNIGLFSSVITNQSGLTNGFGFSSPGRARITQLSTGNQLLLETGLANSAAQLSFRTSAAAAGDVTSGLVAKWALDDTVGTTTTSNPGGYIGTLVNGPLWMPGLGKTGGALYFDGVNDYVRVPRNAAFETPAITIAAWVYANGVQTVNAKMLSKSYSNHTAPAYNTYGLNMRQKGTDYSFATGHSASLRNMPSSTTPLNQWAYVVGTYDPAASAPQKRLYVNGELTASETLNLALYYDTTSTGDLYFGSNGATAERFRGAIDDIRIYNRALTPSEVQQLYAQNTVGQITRSMGIDYSTGGAGGTFKIGKNNAAASDWMQSITAELAVNSSGAVGIGTATPQAAVDVNGAVKIGADYVCEGAAHAGKIRYISTSTPPWQYCDGTNWVSFNAAASGSWSINYNALNTGTTHTCGIKSTGTAWCWGAAADGRLGNNTTTPNMLVPGEVHSDSSATGWTDWLQITADSNQGCGLRSNGTAWCWGSQNSGRLGNNVSTSTSVLRPVQVHSDSSSTGWTDWSYITTRGAGSCGLRSNGTAWCWGLGGNGRLGNATTTSASRPVQVLPDIGSTHWTDWVNISISNSHSCGVRANGTAWCWGEQIYGQLGNNSSTGDVSRPIQVHSDSSSTGWTDWTKLSANNHTVCGIRTNGTAWCWGANANGGLGNNTSGSSVGRPVRVHTDSSATGWTDWTNISVGAVHTCGLRANGTAWCWGYNNKGQIGDGTSGTDRLRPVQVLSSTGGTGWSDWASITAGSGFFTCGVRANGTAWCWGLNASGIDRLLPTQVQ